jgi:ribosomal protein S16
MKQKEWQEEKEKAQPAYEPDDGPLTDEQLNQIKESVNPHPPGWMFNNQNVKNEPEVEKSILESHPYLTKPFDHFKDTTPIVAKPEPKMEEVSNDDMAQDKIIPDEGIMPVAVEAPAGTPEVDRQDVVTGFTPNPAVETVGIEEPVKKTRTSKKKVNVEQIEEDKSSSVNVEDQVNKMIENNDATGLESIYKQIVKELAKNNRSKSTHWGPLKTKK